ncbi:hypothetical protein BST61_g2545 [Cercospora zeina]
MAAKRTAREAFGNNRPERQQNATRQLSAFAAAHAIKSTTDLHASEQAPLPHTPGDLNGFGDVDGRGAHDQYGVDPVADAVSILTVTPDQEDEHQADATKAIITLSTIEHKSAKVDEDGAVVVSMRLDQSVTFLGEFDLQVLTGVVTIYGAMLHPDRGVQRVYAPAVSPLPAIIARKQETVIRATSVSSGLGSMERLSPMFRNVGTPIEDETCSFCILHTSSDGPMGRTLSPLDIDEGMRKALSKVNSQLDAGELAPRILAIGGKSSGKSTFNRILCNTITSRASTSSCFYLDLDPGQPEFGPSGQLSLIKVTAPILGPAFTHPASTCSTKYRIIRSHTIASTSFKDDPDHYLACAIDLCSHAPKHAPLIVNSCGWVNGLGASTIVSFASKLSVSDVVSLEPIETELIGEVEAVVGSMSLRIPRRQRQQALRTPAELRAMQAMAYFHQRSINDSTTWVRRPITELRAWIVSYSAEVPGVTAVLNYGQAPHPDFLGEVLDGSVVAITVMDDQPIDQEAICRTATEHIPYLPQSAQEDETFQLVTPIPESELATIMDKQVVLIRGGFDSPDWAYLEDWYATGGATGSTEERPWVGLQEQAGVEGAIWRMRHPPMSKDAR